MEGAIEGKTSDLGGNHRPIGPDAVGRVDLVDGEHTIVIFDLETTGLHQKEDRVIQLAAKVGGVASHQLMVSESSDTRADG